MYYISIMYVHYVLYIHNVLLAAEFKKHHDQCSFKIDAKLEMK